VEKQPSHDCAFISAKVGEATGRPVERSFIMKLHEEEEPQLGRQAGPWVLPMDLLSFMRDAAIRVELQAQSNERVDDGSFRLMVELRICRLLLNAVDAFETKFLSTLADDEALLDQEQAHPTLPYIEQAALRVRVGEKRILSHARRNIQAMWQKNLEAG
jgi:hypothetical protein